MAKETYYRAIFKTPDDQYYSKALPRPESHQDDAHIQAQEYKRKHNISDKFVTVEWSDEDQFI